MNALSPLEALLKHQFGVHTSRLRWAGEQDNPSIVLWSLESDGSSIYRFSENLADHPHADVLLKNWVQEIPVLANFARLNAFGAGRVWLNVGDMGSMPGLAYCDYRQGYDLLPDPVFMQTAAYADAKATYARNSVAWSSRKPIAFWRGQTTGWYSVRGDAIRNWDELPRVQLCRLAQSDAAQGLLDAGLSGLAQIPSEEHRQAIRDEGLLKEYMHWSDFQQWKFQDRHRRQHECVGQHVHQVVLGQPDPEGEVASVFSAMVPMIAWSLGRTMSLLKPICRTFWRRLLG